MRYFLGVDLGGTNIAVGIVDENYHIVGRGVVKTDLPRPAQEIVKAIEKACTLALGDAGLHMNQIEWIGIGSPGVVNSSSGEVEFANNLDFHNVPLRRMVYELTGRPTYLENDANAAAYGEVLAGGARGYQDVIAITLGTGLGGGIIIGGYIYAGYNHAGAELGHVGMFYGGETCSCGAIGCVESFCSASALIRQTKEKMQQHPDSKLWALCGGDIQKINGRTAFDAMREGDAVGSEVVRQYCDYLGYAVNSFVNLLQPQIVLLGGGISHEGETLLAPVREYVYAHNLVSNPDKRVRIEAATLGNDAGIIGAAFLGNL